MTVLEERIEKLIAPAVKAAGFDLVRVKMTGREAVTLQIMAERPDRTMSAEECALLSRALSPILEAADPIAGAFRLEISSPGIDRPLVRLQDFADWRGHEARIELDRMIDGRKRYTAILAGIEDDQIGLNVEGATGTTFVPFSSIKSAKLTLTDDLIRENLRAAKAAAKRSTKLENGGDHR